MRDFLFGLVIGFAIVLLAVWVSKRAGKGKH